MSIGAGRTRRITQLAVGRHLSYRKVRVRLTLLYGGLFLLSGAALMAIAYALLVNAGFVFSLPNAGAAEPPTGQSSRVASTALPGGFPVRGTRTHPSAQTMAHWLGVARCMRGRGFPGFPDPTTSVPALGPGIGVLSDRDGAILAIPHTIDEQSPAFIKAATECGFQDGNEIAQDNSQRSHTRQQLLIQAGIALAGMSLLSLGLGWLMAGRVLRPLEDSYRAQRQFVANASHELRAPLTRLRALSEVALASPEANFDSLRRAHERVLASEQHLERLIDGLLALTRGQAGLENGEQLNLAALFSQAMLARETEVADLDLDLHTTLDPATTTGDPRLLKRLIANLLDNAIRHNTPGGHVEISTGTRDRHPFLAITNTGPAVPPGEIQRLLQPFQRHHGSRTSHNSGHGLGLSIVQAIATAHEAELTMQARPEGGLAIRVTFPAATEASSGSRFATAWKKRNRRSVSKTDAPVGG
jgi:signal transduction histidine kinase